MSIAICFFDDELCSTLSPLTETHPTWDLWAGTGNIIERTKRLLPELSITALHGREVVTEAASGEIAAGRYVFVNGRLLTPHIITEEMNADGEDVAYYCEGELVAARLTLDHAYKSWEEIKQERISSLDSVECTATLGKYLWDYVYHNADFIRTDAALFPLSRL